MYFENAFIIPSHCVTAPRRKALKKLLLVVIAFKTKILEVAFPSNQYTTGGFMKLFTMALVLLTSSFCLGEKVSLEVRVPTDAKYVYITAKDVAIDACGKYGLKVIQNFKGESNHYNLFLVGTNDYCQSKKSKLVNFWADIKLNPSFDERRSITIHFDTKALLDLKVSYN